MGMTLASFSILFLIYCAIVIFPIFTTIEMRLVELFQLFGEDAANSDDYARLYMLQEGIRAFIDRPIWGSGVYSSNSLFNSYSHNNYIEILLNTGIIGFIVYYGIYIIMGWRLICGIIRHSEYKVFTFMCFILILLIGSAAVYYFSVYFQIIIALVSIVIDREVYRANKLRKLAK